MANGRTYYVKLGTMPGEYMELSRIPQPGEKLMVRHHRPGEKWITATCIEIRSMGSYDLYVLERR